MLFLKKKLRNNKITVPNVRPFLRIMSGRVTIPIDKFKKTENLQVKLNTKISKRISYYLHCEFLIDSELIGISRYIERHVFTCVRSVI